MPGKTLTRRPRDKRQKTRYKGITYREKADGSRTYYVYANRKQHPVQGGEKEAITLQASLRTAAPAPVVPSATKFKRFAEEWFEGKSTKGRDRTRRYHRDALDNVLIPRFGNWIVSAIDADAIAKLVRDLEREGLHALDPSRPIRPLRCSSIQNYLKPLRGILALAARRKLIGTNPFDLLTSDDLPKPDEKTPRYEWSDDDVGKLLAASEEIAKRPTSRYVYTLILKVVARLGLRCGEMLGLRWEDFDKDEATIFIQRQWLRPEKINGVKLPARYGPTKTRAGVRRIALPDDLRDELIAHRLRSRFSQDSDPIFPSHAGTPLSHWNVVSRGFNPSRDLAGLPQDLTFHDLRDAAASRLIAAGLDAVTVAAVMGHEDATTTLRYYASLFNRQRKDELVREALA